MPYYNVGDYYGRGDYYRGDGIFSSIGRGLKVVGGAALGYLTGGPKGAITGAVGGTVGAVKSGIQQETLAAGGSQSAYTPELMAMHDAAVARGMMMPMIAPMAAPGGYMMPAGGVSLMNTGSALPFGGMPLLSGYRWNKSTYATRGGGTSPWPAGLRLHPRGTVMVKSRRMNVANAKALKRGLRRAKGFLKLARSAKAKLSSFSGTRKKKK